MKGYITVKSCLLAAVIGLFIALSACTEDETSDPAPNNNPNNPNDPGDGDDLPVTVDANAVSDDFILQNFTEISGNIPASSNTADLKLDKDTIFLVEGIKHRIRILYPPTFQAVGTFLQVEGSDHYFEIPLEEESTDTVGVLYLEFDPEDWELPFSFDIKIAPHDGSGTPPDEFTRKVVVEKKGETGCSPSNPFPHWVWVGSWVDDSLFAAPGLANGVVTSTNGCCGDDGESIDCIAHFIPENEWISLDYESYLMTNLEYLTLNEDGTLLGQLTEQTQNIDYSESNFCTGAPAYIRRTKDNAFWGEYSYNPSTRKIQFTNLESTERDVYLEEIDLTVTEYDKYYISPAFDYEIISCHYLLERSNFEGQERWRLFERLPSVEFGGEYAPWYD